MASLEDRIDELRGTVEKMVGVKKVDEWMNAKREELEGLSPYEAIYQFGAEGIEGGIERVSKMIVEKISKGLAAGAF